MEEYTSLDVDLGLDLFDLESSSGHSADYFDTLNNGSDVEFTSFGGETNEEQLVTVWPIDNADMLLDIAEPGEVIKTINNEGEEVEFVVAAEYRSASKKLCKNYYVGAENYLACFNPHWNPVRLFK